MKKTLSIAIAVSIAAWFSIGAALAQTSPNLTFGQVLTPAQWNQLFINKQDTLGFTPLNTTGGVMLGPLITFASSSVQAGFNIPPGVAPGTPNNGDIWETTAGLFASVNGVTTNLISPSSLTFGTGANSTIPATSANTGFNNQFIAQNSGTIGTAGTAAELVATLSGGANAFVGLTVSGGTTPSAALISGSGITGGLSISAGAGPLTIVNPSITSLGTGTCQNSLNVTSSGLVIPGVCPGVATAITLGVTAISGGTPVVGNCLDIATGALLGQGDCAFLNVADQTLSGGATLTPFSIGPVSSGTQTVDCGKNPVQFLLNAGAFTLAAPINDSHCLVQVVNGPSAGAITLSGFSTSPTGSGDTVTTANTTSGAATFTASSASIAFTDASLIPGSPVYFTAATMPTGFTSGQIYYVLTNSGTAITVAATPGGSAVTATSTGTTVVAHIPSVFAANIFRINALTNLLWKQQQ
jgi:hypothetical protein